MQIQNLIRKSISFLSVLLVIIWLCNLASTDAYFSVYVLIAFFSFYLQIRKSSPSSGEACNCGLCFILSICFSFFVLLANYPVFTHIGDPALIGRSTSIMVNLINGLLSFFGGICVARPIIQFFISSYPLDCSRYTNRRKWLSYGIFASIFLIHFSHLMFVEYPGNLTEDSFTQISEMVLGTYSNFNTYWHTMLFRCILSAGYAISCNLNAAVCFFVIFQLAILAFSFTHSLITMVDYGIPRWAVGVSYLVFAIIPYNMALTITIWKDVLFAGSCLLMLSSWLRIHRNFDRNPTLNYFVFLLGSLLFIISRTNGWLIYLVCFLIYALFFHENKRFLVVMGSLGLIGWFLLNPALVMLKVEEGDLVESMSIPIQQVSRVIAEGGELHQDEQELLSRVVDLEEVPELYTNWISDPMKVEVRSKDYNYFQDHIGEYASLWIKLGLRYPVQYVKAWVDQTKGYWNAGYDYAMYSETITDNPYGVEKSGGNNLIASLFRLYFGLSRHVIFFEPLHSIGLHVWIFLLCLILNIRKKRDEWFLFIPLLLLLVGLWLGTPVFCCFRYVYPLFISFPLIISTTVWNCTDTIKATE